MKNMKIVEWFIALPEKGKIQACLLMAILVLGPVIAYQQKRINLKDEKIEVLNLAAIQALKEAAASDKECEQRVFFEVMKATAKGDSLRMDCEKDKQDLFIQRIKKLKQEDIPQLKKEANE